ncbi:MAG: DUF362 domain-containing protein [Deltaproteobacteria bacterium]
MSQTEQQPPTNRRDFLRRLLKAVLSIGAASSLSYWLYDSSGPGLAKSEKGLVTLPDFSVPSPSPKMSIVTGMDRVKTINRGLESLGGIETFVKQGDRVLLKVNAAFATPPILSATTNPQLVAEVARLCYKAGASTVVVTDNPINDPTSCFSLTGIAEAAQSTGAKVLLPRENAFEPTTVPNGVLIRNWPILWEPFQGVNKVIGIAPVKDHHRSGASMTMKNWYGLLGGRRNIFHQDIYNIIKELAIMVKPTLVVLDGTTTMMTNGPTGGSLGDLKETGVMIVSTDQVAADSFGATLLGKKPADLPYIAKAEAAGVGTADYESLSPVRIATT